MVRLLTVEEYGQYRDILLYGTLLMPWIQLSINSSLAYFVPKYPEDERVYLSQATFFVLFSSVVVVAMLFLFHDYLPSPTARAFIYALCLYVLFLANLDAWEVYWLAKRKSINVLYYSVARLGLRMAMVITSAYLTRRVEPVIWTLVAFEGARLLALGYYGVKNRLFSLRLDVPAIKRQLGFSLPIGASGILYNLNNTVGQFFVSTWLGAATLAVYSVGTYMEPIVRVFRNSVADVIMPEIVSQQDASPKVALKLWQRATVVYCATLLPIAVLFVYYADVIIPTLFTSQYAAATPVFQIYTLLLVRECFDFGLALRALNRTGVFFVGSALSLILNVAVLVALFDWLGILAPAIAMVVARFFAGVYLSVFIIRICDFKVGEMLPWIDMGKAAGLTLACVPVLLVGDLLEMGPLIRLGVFAALYLIAYVALLRMTGIPEIKMAADRILVKLGRV